MGGKYRLFRRNCVILQSNSVRYVCCDANVHLLNRDVSIATLKDEGFDLHTFLNR